ncbi:IS200/IS605 family accessory protein TnpB-related protein [Salinarchaeum sp. IM2453]|uniref:IS200/IS605 family accessory protein TnpB-related protein n=1 Tax=Salinarchaeum sp. IM2453 TaxID=2862870 RepID=UPI002102FCDB|nr:IS200/IS605 family accessory protein TnpB-related protein [Salinarchaeum sp. IM2453]
MLDTGDLQAPTLHFSEHGYTLDVPVSIPEQETETVSDRVLAVDLGVKKQATAVGLDGGDKTHEQVTPPQFLDHPAKDKLFRVKADAEGINDRLAELRRQGKSHTERFDHLLCEYRQTRRKERRLREQIQHDIANQLVWIAAEHGCETIVFESLGQMESPAASGSVAWSISSWARGELLAYVEYKAGLLGIEFTTVKPWGTSRFCPVW